MKITQIPGAVLARKGQTWLMLCEWFAQKDFFDKLCLSGGKLPEGTMQVFWCVHESELFNEEMEQPSPGLGAGLPRGPMLLSARRELKHQLQAKSACSWGHSKLSQIKWGSLVRIFWITGSTYAMPWGGKPKCKEGFSDTSIQVLTLVLSFSKCFQWFPSIHTLLFFFFLIHHLIFLFFLSALLMNLWEE